MNDTASLLAPDDSLSARAVVPRTDWLTVIAVAIVAHVTASIVHEALGHGGACLLVGCRPQLLTTMQFQGDETSLSNAGVKVIAAGGTLANLAAAGIAAGF